VSARAAWLVGAGIFLSRIAGLVREQVLAFFFGNSAVLDVWRASLRTPNFIQNLLGEGALSASFIPVYSEMLEQGREEDAGRFAGAALGILTTVAFSVAVVGILLAPVLIPFFFQRWEPWQHALGVRLVRVLFLMTAVLVVSAWALGILNSHRKFFISYVAPVLWNLALIATLFVFGGRLGRTGESLVIPLAWGALAGGVLQVAVQLPWVLPVLKHFRLSVSRKVAGVSEAIRNFIPVVAARGVVNVSGLLDTILAGLLAVGAISAIGFAQQLYLLPISLFGMSIAASELPELSRQRTAQRDAVAERVRGALARVAFLLVPSTLAYLVIGDVFVSALFERGNFRRVDTVMVYFVLMAYSLGLFASSSSRVLSSAFYALRDTRTPAWVAYLRVAVSLGVGLALMFPLDDVALESAGPGGAGEVRRLGAMGLALGASAGAWLEYAMLRRKLGSRIGAHGPGRRYVGFVVLAGVVATVLAWGAKALLGSIAPYRAGLLESLLGADSWLLGPVLAVGTALTFGVSYLAATHVLGIGAPLRKLQRRGSG
jgi:putative peptidoglycan lipid II flippase